MLGEVLKEIVTGHTGKLTGDDKRDRAHNEALGPAHNDGMLGEVLKETEAGGSLRTSNRPMLNQGGY